MTVRLPSSMLAALLWLGLSGGTAAGQPSSGTPVRQGVNHIILDGVSEFEAYRRVLIDSDIPAGIVAPSTCGEDPAITFAATPRLSVRQSLDRIMVLAGSRSKWSVADGVVNVVPMEGLPSLLSARIDQTSIPNVPNLTLAIDRLLQVPAVKEMMASQRLVLWSWGSIWSDLPSDGKQPASVPLEIRDMTLLNALNLLVRTHGTAVWAYQEHACSDSRIPLTLQFVRQ